MTHIERNDSCWCGSGKKYKKCHMDFDDKLKRFEGKGFAIPNISLLKTKEDIEGIRKAGNINKEIFSRLKEVVKVGAKTEDIDDLVAAWTKELGGIPAPLNYMGYPKNCCISINEVVCHGIPGERILEDGDIVNIDITTILNGYFADSSEMFLVGNVSDKAKAIVEASQKSLEIGINTVRAWKGTEEIGENISAYAKTLGYSIVQMFGGHGIGKKFQEDPFIYHHNTGCKGMLMVPGMVFTIEPMINEGTFKCDILDDDWTAVTSDRKLSAQWEHTILVTEDGFEILT